MNCTHVKNQTNSETIIIAPLLILWHLLPIPINLHTSSLQKSLERAYNKNRVEEYKINSREGTKMLVLGFLDVVVKNLHATIFLIKFMFTRDIILFLHWI